MDNNIANYRADVFVVLLKDVYKCSPGTISSVPATRVEVFRTGDMSWGCEIFSCSSTTRVTFVVLARAVASSRSSTVVGRSPRLV